MLSVRWDLVTCIFQKLVNGSDVYRSLRTVDVKIKKYRELLMWIDDWRFGSEVQRVRTGYKFRCDLHPEGK